MASSIRRLRSEEYEAYCRVVAAAFGGTVTADDLERESIVSEPDRVFGAFDGKRLVGGNGALTLRLAVPGAATVPVAGITGVGILPSHRRRGLNRELMRRQLDDAHERGEVAAALFASEGGIYGRFGFGIATWDLMLEAEAHRTNFARGHRPVGAIELLPRIEAIPIMHAVYLQDAASRPGMILVDERTLGWHHWEKKDEETPKWFAVHRDGGTGRADGYAVYRVHTKWEGGMAKHEVSVHAAHALTPGAYADIWRYLFDIDLVETVRAVLRPSDEPLMHLTEEPNRLHSSLVHGLWLRIIDVPAALQARAYAAPVSLVIEVDDVFCPWNAGRHRLIVDATGAATVDPTDDSADLSCSAGDLGAVFLGGTPFRRLRRAGQVAEHTPGSLAAADAAFGWDPAPWSSILF